jgi:hypothetical protein
MSFFYDRDQNVNGNDLPTSLTYAASYGTSVSFSCDLSSYTTIDNYLFTMPRGVNHLQMKMNVPFENKKEDDARKIAGFFESLNGTGHFEYKDPSAIYKPIRMFCENINTSFNENDLYTIDVSLSSDQSAPLLNWANPFLSGEFVTGQWKTNTSYSKYDVVRYTGNVTYPANTGNLYDSFYYCSGDGSHTSDASFSATNMANQKWTKEFFFQPTYPTQVAKETSVIKTDLPYSFTKRTDFGLHANVLKSLKLDFKGISDKEAKCILHFLISKQGYRRFQYKFPKIYNQEKYFFAPEWNHTFVYKNVNDISVTLTEDPLGARKVY